MSRARSCLSVATLCLLAMLCGCDTSPGKRGAALSRCAGSCAQTALTAAQTETVLAQAIMEAQRNGVAATIAVVDRSGNVLAVFRMTGAVADLRIAADPDRPRGTGLDGLRLVFDPLLAMGQAFIPPDTLPTPLLPAALAAISKAGTGAYLSSQGNAFSTRTASQIVQEHFNPAERSKAGGPLFGVQFSQLLCGDFVQKGANTLGPRPMPLGFSADPGGLPLYIDGVLVGGVGVESDGIYSADLVITNKDSSLDERIASAAAQGFAAPVNRRADSISVDGRFLRFADDEGFARVAPGPKTLPGGAGALLAVPFFLPGGDIAETAPFLAPASGVVMTTTSAGDPIEMLVDAMGEDRFPSSPSTAPAPGSGGMMADEVTALIEQAIGVATSARAQIRNPLGSPASVNVSVVDLAGNILGFKRTVDAPLFGADVSLQKARTAAFFSSQLAGVNLASATPPLPELQTYLGVKTQVQYLADLRAFLDDPTALANGIAFSDRSGGNLSRPFYPDGIDGRPNGPLSRPIDEWSPFSTGLQLDLVISSLAGVLLDPANIPNSCTAPSLAIIRNGIQIFPGSVPVYRGSQLVGGIGISGDGVDQDDMIGFLGLHRAGRQSGIGIHNAPVKIRSNTIEVSGTNLRFIRCPSTPFIGSSDQDVCDGK